MVLFSGTRAFPKKSIPTRELKVKSLWLPYVYEYKTAGSRVAPRRLLCFTSSILTRKATAEKKGPVWRKMGGCLSNSRKCHFSCRSSRRCDERPSKKWRIFFFLSPSFAASESFRPENIFSFGRGGKKVLSLEKGGIYIKRPTRINCGRPCGTVQSRIVASTSSNDLLAARTQYL